MRVIFSDEDCVIMKKSSLTTSPTPSTHSLPASSSGASAASVKTASNNDITSVASSASKISSTLTSILAMGSSPTNSGGGFAGKFHNPICLTCFYFKFCPLSFSSQAKRINSSNSSSSWVRRPVSLVLTRSARPPCGWVRRTDTSTSTTVPTTSGSRRTRKSFYTQPRSCASCKSKK